MAVQIVTEPGAIIHISTINALWAYTNYIWLPDSGSLALEDAIAVTVTHYAHNPAVGAAYFKVWAEVPPGGDAWFNEQLSDFATEQAQYIELDYGEDVPPAFIFGFSVTGRRDHAITSVQLHK